MLRNKYAAPADKLVVPEFPLSPVILTCGVKNLMKMDMCDPQTMVASISVAQLLPQGEPRFDKLRTNYQVQKHTRPSFKIHPSFLFIVSNFFFFFSFVLFRIWKMTRRAWTLLTVIELLLP